MTIGSARLTGRVLVAGMMTGAVLAAATAQRTPDGGPDIVVTGGVPVMVAGLWRFRSGTRLTDPAPGMRPVPPRRGEAWTTCIRDGDTPAILEQLIGRAAAFGDEGLCSAMRMTIARDRVSGSRRCQLIPRMTDGDALLTGHLDTRLRATIGPTSLAAGYTAQVTIRNTAGAKTRWQVVAERIGGCGPSPTAPAIARSDAATPEEPRAATAPREPVPGPAPGPARIAPPAPASQPPVPTPSSTTAADPPRPDDIVVVAHKLRRLRLHYAGSGRAFRWCHADVSSGDARLDRIGCAIVRSCVREGFDEPATVLACFHRRVDLLGGDDPPAAAGQSR